MQDAGVYEQNIRSRCYEENIKSKNYGALSIKKVVVA